VDIEFLKNKLKNTLHYTTETNKLFSDYITSLFPKDYEKNNIKISNFSYQPVNKSIHFMVELLPIKEQFSICYININISLEKDKISYSFDESPSKYDENNFFNKKYLFDALYDLIKSISIKKLNSIFESSKILKKEYMKLERDIKKLEEEHYYNKYKKYQMAVINMFPPLDKEKIDNLVEEYKKKATEELYLKKPDFDKEPESVYDVFRKKETIVYFEFNKDKIQLCEGKINFNFDKNKTIKFKINNEVVSKKKFVLALSNQFHIEGKLVSSLHKALENAFFQVFIDNTSFNSGFINQNRSKMVNIEDFCKPFLVNTIANNF
tara:strand:+ start:995 stop:1960 length:966 start_codon:yes stop_codon:yes gene_type:complete